MTGTRRLRPLLVLGLLVLAFASIRQGEALMECQGSEGRFNFRTGECDTGFEFSSDALHSGPAVRFDIVFVALLGAGVAVWLRRRALRERA